MKNILSCVVLCLLIVSCSKQNLTGKEYSATEIHTIPYGEEGVLREGDYSGKGASTNTSGTTVSVQGNVTVDALSAGGAVIVPAGSVLTVNTVMNVGGGANLDVQGTLICQSFTQVGNTYLSNAKMEVNGKYTIGGGTTLYMENSHVAVDELVITGNIKVVDNLITQAANWYSMIELTGVKYLHRGWGTHVCGPVLFNDNNDVGGSDAKFINVTDTAVAKSDTLQVVYGLPVDFQLFQFDDTCDGLAVMPAH